MASLNLMVMVDSEEEFSWLWGWLEETGHPNRVNMHIPADCLDCH